MSSILIKNPTENSRQYIWRLCLLKKQDKLSLSWDELADVINKEIKDYSEPRTGEQYNAICNVISTYYDDVFSKLISDDKLSDKLDTKLANLTKQRMELSALKADYNRNLREDAKDSVFSEKVIEAIQSNRNITPDPTPIIINKENKRAGLLCFSDAHFGKEFKIYGLNDEVLNEYSPEIFYKRMDILLGNALDIIRKEGLQEITVYNLGDHVEGFIRHSQAWSLRWGVVDSAINFGYFMSDWLRKLSENVKVTYCQTDGNHDEMRLLDGKKKQHLSDTSGKIITALIEVSNANNPNLTIKSNKTGLAYTTLVGYNILGIHGEVKSLDKAILEFTNIYKTDISYLIGGHKHHGNYKTTGVRKGVLGLGSIIGSDDYSISIMATADPTGSFYIFEEGKGKVLDYTIVLD